MRTLLTLAACVSLAGGVGAALWQDFSKIEITVVPVAGPVHMLMGGGGNIGVSAGPDGVLIVDDQFAPLAEKIRAALKGLGNDTPRFVLNTHWHGDHTGGNAIFGRTGTIVAHQNVRARLADPASGRARGNPPAPPEALPVVTFADGLSIHWNGEEIRLRHLPAGHTDGDSVVHFMGSNVIHTGDLFFVGKFPYVDLGSGGDVEGYARNVGTILEWARADTKIIPGHGPLATREELAHFHQVLVTSIAFMRGKLAEGKTLQQILAGELPPDWATWGDGFVKTPQWLATMYASLTRAVPGGAPK